MKYVGLYNENQDIATKEKLKSCIELKNKTVDLPEKTYLPLIVNDLGRLIMVNAYSKNVLASENGITWTIEGTLPYEEAINLFFAANDMFIIGCENGGMFCGYGVSDWHTVDLSISSVTYNDEIFVACSNSGDILYNDGSDLSNWSTAFSFENESLNSITYGNGKFVVVGNNGFIAYSDDGMSWTQATYPRSGNIEAVAYGSHRFVALEHNGYGAYSDDGINWTQITYPGYTTWLIYGNGEFVVSNDSGYYWYSSDGIIWIERVRRYGTSTSFDSGNISIYNGKFVSAQRFSTLVAYSDDLVSWSSTLEALQYPDGTDVTQNVKNLVNSLPTVTTSDDGKFLQVVNGEWVAGDAPQSAGVVWVDPN